MGRVILLSAAAVLLCCAGFSLASRHNRRPFYRKLPSDVDYQLLSVCAQDQSDALTTNDGDKCEKGVRVALGKFNNAINQTGWAFFEVHTNAEFQPEVQAYAAGVAEGVLLKQLIYYHIKNTVDDICGGKKEYCQRLTDYLGKQQRWIREKLLQGDHTGFEEKYWKQVNITISQLSGIQHAYEGKQLAPSVSFDLSDVYMIQLSGELIDLAKALKKNSSEYELLEEGKCTGLVRLTDDGKELFFAHVAISGLQTMTRVLKLYNFAFDETQYPGRTAAFSGSRRFG